MSRDAAEKAVLPLRDGIRKGQASGSILPMKEAEAVLAIAPLATAGKVIPFQAAS